MSLDLDLFEQAIREIGPPAGYPSPLPAHVAQWLEGLPLSEDWHDFLHSHSAASDYEVGPVTLYAHRSVFVQTTEFPHVVESHHLLLGTALSGDPLAMDMTSGAIGYLPHDRLWSIASPGELRSLFRRIAPSVGSCVERALRDRDFPADYHQAETG